MKAAEISRKGIFVTGTDTGVGKTIVSAALAGYLARFGLRVAVMKPVETGVDPSAEIGEDARLLCQAAGFSAAPDRISPYRFEQPLSPDQAASASGVRIEQHRLIQQARQLQEGSDFLIVEGAGGLMVPLVGGYLMADLVRDLDLPLVVVAKPTLGTINHTLLTTFAARALELEVCGIFINGMPSQPGKAEQNAPHAIASLASASLLGVLPHVDGSNEDIHPQLTDYIAQMETRAWLHAALGLTVRETGGRS